jgi:hypothetical protein
MIGDDIASSGKPEIRNLREQFTLLWDRLGKYHIECGQPVGGYDQHIVIVDAVYVSHLASGDQFQISDIGFKNAGQCLVGTHRWGINRVKIAGVTQGSNHTISASQD